MSHKTYFLAWLLRTRYPKIPPIIDAARIPILTSVICSSLVKARDVTNKDVVNPIEANKVKPRRFLIFIPEGNEAIFIFLRFLDFYKTTHFIINLSFHY